MGRFYTLPQKYNSLTIRSLVVLGVALLPYNICRCQSAQNMLGVTTFVAYAPVADPQEITVSTTSAIPLVLTGYDANGTALSFQIVDPPALGALGSVNASTGSATYTPPALLSGSDSFSFVVTSGVITSEPATVTILLTPPASQTITFNTIPPQSLGTPLTLNATASSGLAVAYTPNTPLVCTVSGNTATFLTGGTCSITASQSGNTTYAPATPVTQTFTVLTTAGTTTALVANPTTAAQGDPVVLSATVSGNPAPTGTVTFSNGGTTLGTKTLSSSGVAALTSTTLPLGTLSLTASYAGNTKDSPSTSNAVAVTIHASAGPPTVVSVTPNSGSGASQTFSAVYSDPNGAADLATVRLLFNSAVSGAHGCYVTYYPATNLLYLENDGGTGTLPGVTPGSTASASNSQCTLAGTGSSYSAAGNTATLNVALTFTSTLPENVYLYASESNATASNSGWIKEGTWGASAGPPTVVSVTPNSGSGASQTFSAVYSDPNGAADLATVRLLFNSAVSGAHGCYVTYYPATNLLYLENDGGTGTLPGVTPGSTASASNSQCTLAGTGSSYSAAGNTATLNVALTFTSTLPENVYLYASESNATASNSGWIKEGTWGASAGPPTVVSVTPNSGSGASQTFSAVYSDPNGAADLATVRLLFNSAVSGAHGCYVTYYPATNLLYLENDGGTGTLPGVTPGSTASASNSQCTLAGTGSSYSAAGNTATLNVALTFTSTLPENVYLYASESNATASNSGWIKEGTWGASAGPPTVVSVTPNSGSGASQTFSAVYSDPNGAADLATVRLLFNSAVSGAHGCYVTYYPATNLLYLENDGGTGTLPGVTPGSTASASNSQCTLAGTGSSYSAAGNTATLNVALTFTSTLPENVYLYASESNATASNSGWIKEGTWGASAGPPTVVSVTPNSGSGASQMFSAVYSDPNGAADLATVRLLFNSAVSGAHGCYVTYYPATNLLYLENDGGTGTLPGVTPGSTASASNSQCTLAGTGSSYSAAGNTATLNVALTFTSTLPENVYLYASESNATASNSGWIKEGTWGASAGPPTVVSVTPNSGSGASQTFSAVYSDPNGAADLATVRLLFNSAVSGAHGCYVTYYPATNLLYLENDGGTGTLPGVSYRTDLVRNSLPGGSNACGTVIPASTRILS